VVNVAAYDTTLAALSIITGPLDALTTVYNERPVAITLIGGFLLTVGVAITYTILGAPIVGVVNISLKVIKLVIPRSIKSAAYIIGSLTVWEVVERGPALIGYSPKNPNPTIPEAIGSIALSSGKNVINLIAPMLQYLIELSGIDSVCGESGCTGSLANFGVSILIVGGFIVIFNNGGKILGFLSFNSKGQNNRRGRGKRGGNPKYPTDLTTPIRRIPFTGNAAPGGPSSLAASSASSVAMDTTEAGPAGGYTKHQVKKSTNKNRKINKTKKPKRTLNKNKKSKHNSSQKNNKNKKTNTKKHRHTIRHK
jgi:hypothetical protein